MIAATETFSKSDVHSTWRGQSVRPCIALRCSSAVLPTNPVYYFGATLAVALSVTSGVAKAQSNSFTYETPRQRAADSARESLARTSYICARAIAFGDINGGVRKRTQIDHDPRMLNCFNIILRSNWFPEKAKLPLFEKIVNRAIDDVLATG